MATYREERIRQLAHEIWEREGHPHGRDTEHWHMATEAYEAEMFSSRLNDAGQSMEGELHTPQEGVMRSPPVASPDVAAVAQPVTSQAAPTRKPRTPMVTETVPAAEVAAVSTGRGRKPRAETAPPAETAPKRKRRTKAEMAAAAAGMAGAAAAVVATVGVTKRRRGTNAETAGDPAAASAASVALRRPRKARSGTTLTEAEPAPEAAVNSAATGAIPDPSANEPTDDATDLLPDPAAGQPSDAAQVTGS